MIAKATSFESDGKYVNNSRHESNQLRQQKRNREGEEP
jgi:hypothetical protein